MSKHDPVRRIERDGKPVLVIDFHYIDTNGKRQRYRRDANVQQRVAARAEAGRLMDLAARTGSPFGRATTTFASFIETTFRPIFMPRYRPGTKERYEGILRQSVLPHFGRMPLDAIGATEVLAFAAQLRERTRKRTLRSRTRGIDPRGPVNFVKTVLRAAVDAKVLDRMPELPSFGEPEKLPDAPAAEHVANLIQNAPAWLAIVAALQGLAGLRQGEVRALEVGDIDFETGLIRVRRAFSENELVPPKGGRERVVPMVPELAEMLRAAARGKRPNALVVADDRGRPMRRQRLLAELKAFERRAGLKEWWSHALRHYFCTALTRGGANLEAVRVLAGHRNLRTTQRYLHANGADLRTAIGRLNAGN